MGLEFTDGIKRGRTNCSKVVYMGCEFEVILMDDIQYFKF